MRFLVNWTQLSQEFALSYMRLIVKHRGLDRALLNKISGK